MENGIFELAPVRPLVRSILLAHGRWERAFFRELVRYRPKRHPIIEKPSDDAFENLGFRFENFELACLRIFLVSVRHVSEWKFPAFGVLALPGIRPKFYLLSFPRSKSDNRGAHE